MFKITHTTPTLYKRDSKGGVRTWRMEAAMLDDITGAHRTITGLKDGKKVESGWTHTEGKNIGKKNASNVHQQAIAEVEAALKKRLDRGYFISEADIDIKTFTKPMLAQDIEKRVGKWEFPVYSQPKLDGIRCIARADGLWTRTGKPILACPHIWEALSLKFDADPDLVLDGELYNHDLKDDFNKLSSLIRKQKPSPEQIAEAAEKIEYHVYDIPSEETTFSDRLVALQELSQSLSNSPIRFVETSFVTTQETLDELYQLWMGDGYEGQMVRLEGFYEFKRSMLLMKRKDFMTDEFPVLRMEEGVGNWAGAVKRFIILLPNGEEGEAVPRGKYDVLAKLLTSDDCPNWTTVRFFGWTPAGKPRFPISVDWGNNQRVD